MITPKITKATDFYAIQDAVASNIPVDDKHEFYEDFSKHRSSFKEKKIFRNLAINEATNDCNVLQQPKKIFISGYRGTGKTSELLKLTNSIHKTKCYFTIFVDISDEELDTNNIQTVDILILMLEKLLKQLEDNNIKAHNEGIMKSFYDWYFTRIKEVNSGKSVSVSVDAEASIGTSLLNFIKLSASTKSQLRGSNETKEVIRRVFNQHFSDFVTKFNEFVLGVKEKLSTSESSYKDMLLIIDGFEKIGSLADRRKILIEDSNKFTLIRTHMMITLPIELFSEVTNLSNFATILHLPLIDLDQEGAKETLKEFILKRVDRKLFEDDATIDEIIKFGAGHPRQTLQIISQAFVEAEGNKIDNKSVTDTVRIIGKGLSVLDKEELEVLKNIKNGIFPPATDVYVGLKAKNIILEYSDSKNNIINPILVCNAIYKQRLENL